MHTVKWHVLDTLKNLRLHRQLEICNKLLQEASFEPDEKMQFVWNSQAILKIITDLYSGRILQACVYRKIAMTRLSVTVSNRLNAGSQNSSLNSH